MVGQTNQTVVKNHEKDINGFSSAAFRGNRAIIWSLL